MSWIFQCSSIWKPILFTTNVCQLKAWVLRAEMNVWLWIKGVQELLVLYFAIHICSLSLSFGSQQLRVTQTKLKQCSEGSFQRHRQWGEVSPLLPGWHACHHDSSGHCRQQIGVCSSVSDCNHVTFSVLCRFCCHHSCCCHLEIGGCVLPSLTATSHPLHAHAPSWGYLDQWKSRRGMKCLKSLELTFHTV